MCLCNLHDEGLAIYPTHRVVMSHRDVDRRFLQAFSIRELPAGTPAAEVEAELNAVPTDTIAFARLARLRAAGADRRAERSVGGDAGDARRAGRGARDRRGRAGGARALAAARPRRRAVPDDRRASATCAGSTTRRRWSTPARPARRSCCAPPPSSRCRGDGGRARDAAEVDVLLPEAVVGLPAQPAVGRLTSRLARVLPAASPTTWTAVLRRCPPVTTASRWSARAWAATTRPSIDQEAEAAVVRRLEALDGARRSRSGWSPRSWASACFGDGESLGASWSIRSTAR